MRELLCALEKYSGVILAFAGLLWAIGTFWWMHWHKGKILVAGPRAYAALSHPTHDFLLIRLPLVFYNTGAASRVVQNLRLTLEQGVGKSPVLYFNQTVSKLDGGQEGEWARQFPVEGRKAVSLICEFLRKPRQGFAFSTGSCDATLEGKLDSDTHWKVLSKFKLRVTDADVSTLNSEEGLLIAYDNDPDRER